MPIFPFLLSNLLENSVERWINFFVGFFGPIWKEHVVWVFLEKASALQYKFAMANYMTDFGKEENSPRSSRVMRLHRIDRPNVMASEASGEAFLLTGCIKKMRCPGACLRETVKRTWDHLWPRVYSVFSETLPCRLWFYTKNGETLIFMTRSSWLW